MKTFRKIVWHIVHPISTVLTEAGIRMNWRWLFNIGGGLECWSDEFYWGDNWAEEEAKWAAREQEVADMFAYWDSVEGQDEFTPPAPDEIKLTLLKIFERETK